jgi:hypothetical protein
MFALAMTSCIGSNSIKTTKHNNKTQQQVHNV